MFFMLKIAAYLFIIVCVLSFCTICSILFLEICGNNIVENISIWLLIPVGFFGVIGAILLSDVLKDALNE